MFIKVDYSSLTKEKIIDLIKKCNFLFLEEYVLEGFQSILKTFDV